MWETIDTFLLKKGGDESVREHVEVIFGGEPAAACLKVSGQTLSTNPIVLGQRTLAILNWSDITQDKLLITRRL